MKRPWSSLSASFGAPVASPTRRLGLAAVALGLTLAVYGISSWWGWGMLELTPPDRHHAVRLFWDEHGVFEGWYVNLQEPIRRHRRGYDTMDWQLDIWVTPDGTASWKDEDDLDTAIRDRLLSQAQAEQARAEGERVIAERPWPTGWENWRPPADWTPLALPDGWDNV